jgi:hypothetical protein
VFLVHVFELRFVGLLGESVVVVVEKQMRRVVDEDKANTAAARS